MLELLSLKNVPKIGSKIFGKSFTDHLKHKIVNKTTCRMPLVNPRQL